MTKKISIRIEHKGQDYYGVNINGEYGEVSLSEGEIIRSALKIIMEIKNTNNTFQKV